MEKTSENEDSKYDISFFKPTTELARINRNLTVVLISIWVVAIFGFQLLLKIIEKPTPEPIYVEYATVWGDFEKGNESIENQKIIAKSTLTVLCKVFINSEERVVLDNAFGATVYQLIEDKDALKKNIKIIKDTTSTAEEYANAKKLISNQVALALDIDEYSVLSKISPLELNINDFDGFTDANKVSLPLIMDKYLIHNQSFLTDFKFLGFPFHYFYTAVFLLILFLGICWVYCVKTDRIMEKLEVEKTS